MQTKFLNARSREAGLGMPQQFFWFNTATRATAGILAATAAPADGATTTVTTGFTNPGVESVLSRTVRVVASTDPGSDLELTARIVGTDFWGNDISELLTGITTTFVETLLAFSTVTRAIVTTVTGFDAGDQFEIGQGDAIGVPYRIAVAADIDQFFRGNIDIASDVPSSSGSR